MNIPNRDDKVMLKGKTRHGKNRINQHGDIWVVENTGTFGGQPAMFLRSLHKTEGPKDNKDFDTRWILVKKDKDFDWFF